MSRWLIKTTPQTSDNVKDRDEILEDVTDRDRSDSDFSNAGESSDETEEEISSATGTPTSPSPKRQKRKPWTPKIKPLDVVNKFPWLDEKLKYPYCKVCHTKISGGLFHLKRHESATTHIKRMHAAKSTPLVKMYLDKNDAQSHLVKKAELKMAAFVCIHNLAFLLLDHLPLLQKNIFPDSKICNNIKMKRKKATQLVTEVLAPYFKKQTVKDIKKQFFSLIIDETTDISTEKSLIVIVRYWKNGSVRDRILDLIKVENATAEALFTSIKNLFDEQHILYSNMIAFAADGASTTMGRISGVQAKLKEIAPHIYVQTCTCHSLNLCASSATKQLPDDIEQLARNVYSYFAHSSKRVAELAECQVFANEKPHKMLYVSQTRWLSLKVC